MSNGIQIKCRVCGDIINFHDDFKYSIVKEDETKKEIRYLCNKCGEKKWKELNGKK